MNEDIIECKKENAITAKNPVKAITGRSIQRLV